MITIGCHLSAAKGFLAMGKDAVQIGANTLQFFTRNPRGGKAKALDMNDIAFFRELAEERQFGKIVAHAPYTMNACSADPKVRDFSLEMMRDDLTRLEYLPGNYYNFHPGSHVGQGVDIGIRQIADQLNQAMWADQQTTVLLETMAGKGSEIGSNFLELRKIMDRTVQKEKLGICLDTCHLYDAGYDLVQDLDGVLEEFDQVIGLKWLKAIHLNDSMNPLGSHKDRHQKLGQGYLGLGAVIRIINHPALRHLPFCLETPHEELSGYAGEIALLRAEEEVV